MPSFRTTAVLFWPLLVIAGCSAEKPGSDDPNDTEADADADADSDMDADADADSDVDLDLPLRAQIVAGAGGTLLVSNGIPFAQGQLPSSDDIALLDGDTEISIHASALATWADGSVRSVLVQFERDAANFPVDLTLAVGQTRGTDDRSLVPVDWTLPEAVAFPDEVWLSASGVSGPQVPMGEVAWAAAWETQQRDGFDELVGDGDWGDDCRYDGYYSTTHSWYQLFVRSGDLEVFEWARREAVHYRDDQIEPTGQMNGRSEPRYLYQKALETDYLLTGDPTTLEVGGLMADYVLDAYEVDYFLFESDDEHFWTERRVGFALLNPVIYGRLTNDSTYLDALESRVDNLLATQDQWPDGGFIHNLYAHDPAECTTPGTYGGSPFMTGLLFEGLIAYYELTGDERIVDSVAEAADWLYDEGWTGDSFQYQIGCEGDTAWGATDLNLLVAHGFAFAAYHTGEQRHADRALEIWDAGVDGAFLGSRKHYNQNYRSSPSALWYMSR